MEVSCWPLGPAEIFDIRIFSPQLRICNRHFSIQVTKVAVGRPIVTQGVHDDKSLPARNGCRPQFRLCGICRRLDASGGGSSAPVVVFSWTGPYLGLATGYAWGNTDIQTPASGDEGLSPDGWLLGGFAGYNYQFGSGLVLGAEGDIEWTDLSHDGSAAGIDFSADLRWEGSIRSRIGYAYNRALFYGTTGLAVGGFHGRARPWPRQ